MANRLGFIKNVIYRLKMSYGLPIDIYQIIPGGMDRATGIKTVSRSKWHVNRAITLPRGVHRDAMFRLLGNQQFAYGNVIEVADREVIVDLSDLPFGFKMGSENWYLVIDNKHYEVKKIDEFDENAALMISLKQLVGAPLERIVEITMESQIGAAQTVEGTV